MRRLLSILLIAVLGLPLVSPLLGQDGDATVPVCCRRGGVHHCIGSMGQAAPGGTTVGAVQARCPYCPGAVASVHVGGMLAARVAVGLVVSASGRLRVGRVRSRSRVLRGEACPKRGPPGLSLL